MLTTLTMVISDKNKLYILSFINLHIFELLVKYSFSFNPLFLSFKSKKYIDKIIALKNTFESIKLSLDNILWVNSINSVLSQKQ